MKKIALAALLAATMGIAHADIITFEGTGNEVLLTAGYGGVNWSNFYGLDATASVYANSGYANVLQSGTNVGFNGNGTPASISAVDASGFDLTSGFFAGAWNNGLNITATATFENGTSASTSFVVNTTGATNEFFGWTDLASVNFVSNGGTPQAGLLGSGTQFAVDNLNTTAAVPEPANAALLLAGVGLLAVAARRRRSV